eukprot:361902-Chlamydomonas_euryale.AAC.6
MAYGINRGLPPAPHLVHICSPHQTHQSPHLVHICGLAFIQGQVLARVERDEHRTCGGGVTPGQPAGSARGRNSERTQRHTLAHATSWHDRRLRALRRPRRACSPQAQETCQRSPSAPHPPPPTQSHAQQRTGPRAKTFPSLPHSQAGRSEPATLSRNIVRSRLLRRGLMLPRTHPQTCRSGPTRSGTAGCGGCPARSKTTGASGLGCPPAKQQSDAEAPRHATSLRAGVLHASALHPDVH